jgi:integrase
MVSRTSFIMRDIPGQGATLEPTTTQLPATIQQAEVTSDLRASNVVPAIIADLGDQAGVTAALKMKLEDLRPRGAGWTIRLHEKGGKHHLMPCHHILTEALHAYINAAGIAEDRKGSLFPDVERAQPQCLIRSADGSVGRVAHDPAPCQGRGHPCPHRQPYVSRHRHHQLPLERRLARARPGTGRARESAHNQTL